MKNIKTIILAMFAGTVSAQVGIGTSTPSVPLDIEATDAALDINNTAADGDPKINFQLSGVTTFSIGVDDGDSDKFKIGTTAPDASTALTIDASQNVGIGNTSPTAKLDVDGSAIFNESGAAVDFKIEGDLDAELFYVDGSADMIGIGTSAPSDKLHIRGGGIRIDTDDDGDIAGIAEYGDGLALSAYGDAAASPLIVLSGSNTSVGIGETSPAANLDVNGDLILQNGSAIDEFSTDGTMAGNSDLAVPTEQAVVEYVAQEQQVLTKAIIIEAPTNTDYFPIFRTDVAITIQDVRGMLNAAGDVDVRMYWDTDFAETSPTAIGATRTLTTTSDVQVWFGTDPTIPADSWIFVDVSEATTPQTLTVSVRYTED